jgi:hypothetical protein
LEPLKGELAQFKTAHASSVLQGQILEVEILSGKSELRHLDQKCLSLGKEVARLRRAMSKQQSLQDRLRTISNDMIDSSDNIAASAPISSHTPLLIATPHPQQRKKEDNGSAMSIVTHSTTQHGDISEEHHYDGCGCADIFSFSSLNTPSNQPSQQYKYSAGHIN